MPRRSCPLPRPDPTITLLAAAPSEAAAIGAAWSHSAPPSPIREGLPFPLDDRFRLVRTGIGKVNAAIAAVLTLERTPAPAIGPFINLGICGALPRPGDEPPLPLGAVIIASASIYADEGLALPPNSDPGDSPEFMDLAAMGFPIGGDAFGGSAIPGSTSLIARAQTALAALAPVVAPIATVSTCSGTDPLARAVARRTGALAEAMEGAAIAHALARSSNPPAFLEVRVVSNTTGDRPRQVWKLRESLERLREVASAIRTAEFAP